MIVKGIQGEPEDKREVEATKEEEVDVDDKTVEESARDPSSTISDSSCQSSLAKPSPVPGRIRGPARRSTKGGWTEEEDELLARAVRQFKGKNWKKIAELFPGRTDVQCLHRWQKVLDPELVKGAWTKEEDECIIKLVNKYGAKKWATIANKMTGRIGKQCRERWHNHLNPAIKKCAWTTEEEIILIRAHGMYGNKWAEIAKLLPGRADNSIKNHWNCSVKKKLDSYLSSGLLDSSNKNGALDLNSGLSVRGQPHDLVTQQASMELDEKSTTAKAFNASSPNLPRENESSRNPRENSDYCKTIAQPLSMEIPRSSRGIPDYIKAFADKNLDATSPTGRCLTYLASGEDSNHATARDYGTSFCCKNDYSHRTTSNAILPVTTQPNPSAQMAIHGFITKELFASPEKSERHAKSMDNLDAPRTSSKLSEHHTPAILENTPMDVENAADSNETPCTPVPVDMEVLDHDRYVPSQSSGLHKNIRKFRILESDKPSSEFGSPNFYYGSPRSSRATSVKFWDPEAILRNAAMTFRKTPSIISKGRQNNSGSSPTTTPCKTAVDSTPRAESVASSMAHAYLHQYEIEMPVDQKSNDAQHVRQLFPSSSAPSKSRIRGAVESVEKRPLEHTSDGEWNDTDTSHSPAFDVGKHIKNPKNSQDQPGSLGRSFSNRTHETIATYD